MKKLLFSSIFILFVIISCEDNVTENITKDEPPTLSDVKILYPNGGEILIGGTLDTIRWSNSEVIESMGLYYTLDNGSTWQSIKHNMKSPTGTYLWKSPSVISESCKIKIMAYANDDEYIIESDSVFSILESIQIIEPASNSVFINPQSIKITWKCLVPFDRFEVYYSKYNQTVIYYGYPDNKIEYSSKWILLNENVDGTLREYIWDNPYLYSNKVQIKVIGFSGDDACEVVSSNGVFTVYTEDILFEEREYQKKFSVGNKWVYKVTVGDHFYYIINETVSQFVQDSMTFYEVGKKIITPDTVYYSHTVVQDRKHYSSEYILQDDDKFIKECYVWASGHWRMDIYFSNSCKIYEEEVFSNQALVKEYNFYNSGSGIYSEKIKRAKDLGSCYYVTNSEGYITKSILIGAYIDGVLYGDTTTVQ